MKINVGICQTLHPLLLKHNCLCFKGILQNDTTAILKDGGALISSTSVSEE